MEIWDFRLLWAAKNQPLSGWNVDAVEQAPIDNLDDAAKDDAAGCSDKDIAAGSDAVANEDNPMEVTESGWTDETCDKVAAIRKSRDGYRAEREALARAS